MRKFLNAGIMIFIVLFFMQGCQSIPNKKTTCLQDEGLRGKIKTVINNSTQFTYDSPMKGDISKSTFLYKYNYNNGGYKVQADENGHIISYKYDEKGYLIEEFEGESSYNRYTSRKKIYKYDSHGNIIKKEDYVNNKYTRKEVYEYEYDKNGNIIEKTTQDNEVYHYSYDDNGKVLEKKRSWREFSGIYFYYCYDDNGNLLKSIHPYTSYGSIILETICYKYDSMGNRIEMLEYKKEIDARSKASEIFGKDYNTTMKMLSPDNGILKGQCKWKYDANGNITEEEKLELKSFNGSKKMLLTERKTFTYEFY